MLNRIVLVGRLTRDPEMKYTPSGKSVSTFRIAVNRRFANQQGEREADFIDIVTWGQTAEFAANYLTKGRLVAVEGRLQIRSYTAQDGSQRRVAEVVADNVSGLDRAREPGEGGSGGAHAAPSGGGAAHPDEPPPYEDPFGDE